MSAFVDRLKANWKSGLTVSLVSIPLSVSLAVASQSTPTAGIITAIWAGLLAAVFGGSHYNIVGPTGALSGILAAFALMHGAHTLPMLALVTGIFVLIAYACKFEKFLVFVPGSTMQGFTLGVAFIIAANQFNYALGLTGLPSHPEFIKNVWETLTHAMAFSPTALVFCLASLAFLFACVKWSPKIPGAILLSPIAIMIGYLSETKAIPLTLQTLGMKFPDIAPKLFQAPTLFLDRSLIMPALTVALVAILETMISAKIADHATKTKHHKRKEMLGLGLANVASGLAGGIPATAALARTSLNIKTGATHQTSAAISSVCIALISFFLLAYFRYIPMAAIAAILMFVAFRMVEVHAFTRMFRTDRKEFALAMVVAFVTIFEDPIVGILFGTAASLLLFMERVSHAQFELIVGDGKGSTEKITGESLEVIPPKGKTVIYSMKGQLAYFNGPLHVHRFEHGLSGFDHVILRLRELYFVDLDGVEYFDEIVGLIKAQGKEVYVTGVNPLIEGMLRQSAAFKEIEQKGRVFARTSKCLEAVGAVV